MAQYIHAYEVAVLLFVERHLQVQDSYLENWQKSRVAVLLFVERHLQVKSILGVRG